MAGKLLYPAVRDLELRYFAECQRNRPMQGRTRVSSIVVIVVYRVAHSNIVVVVIVVAIAAAVVVVLGVPGPLCLPQGSVSLSLTLG